jgi:hypothetical protein
MIVAAFISDRPADLYLDKCLAAFMEYVDLDLISEHEVFYDLDHEYGMAGNAQRGFEWAASTDADFVLWCEEDMIFTRPVPLKEMRSILDAHDHLAQVVLKREPWSQEEIAAGGQMECAPHLYTQCSDKHHSWMEHQTLFSMNPCLIPRDVFADMAWWPGAGGVERSITDAALGIGYSFAYYGRRHDPPYVRHVGHIRSQGHRW